MPFILCISHSSCSFHPSWPEPIGTQRGHAQKLATASLFNHILSRGRAELLANAQVSLNNIVTSCLQFIEVKADKLDISMAKHLAEDLPAMLVDRQQIKQVMMNLAMNAMDAMAKTGGRLTVTTRRVVRLDKSGWVQIEVADTGCGIAPEDLPHVFDPFFTTKYESTEHVGTGLGLSIVHQIIQEHGGTVEARSTVGKGTSFLITLPEGRSLDPLAAPASSEWQGGVITARRIPTLQ